MTNYIQVEGEPNMYRDSSSGAIVYINNSEHTREAKKKRREQAKENEKLRSEVIELKNEMSEIKKLLHQLIER